MKHIAIIGSDFINALSVYKSLKRVNFIGKIYSITSRKYKLLSTIYRKEVTSLNIENPKELINFIMSLDKEVKKFILLTNELFHSEFYKNKEILKEHNVIFYFGDLNPNNIIDKDKFAEIFENDTKVPTPILYNTTDSITQPVVVKFKNSYEKGKKTLPIKIIKNQLELKNYIQTINDKGFDISNLIIQEKLSSLCKDNISIVGWFEDKKSVFYQTRKLIQHPKMGGTGDLVELMELDNDLKYRTEHILNKIKYKGPFEVEFIKGLGKEADYKLLEINPRFWMQNGLIDVNSDSIMINSFLSKKTLKSKKKYKYWINLPRYIKSLLILDKKAWYYLPKILFNTYSPVSIKNLIIYMIRK